MEESFAAKKKQQRAANSVCNVNINIWAVFNVKMTP